MLRLPDHREIAIEPDAEEHPLLGRCDRVCSLDGTVLALGSAVDWRRPREIPALDRPGALPRGAGTAILNLLAWQARRAGDEALRYRGPYPSEALWTSLRASFRVEGSEAEAEARFFADAEARMRGTSVEPIDVTFRPDPHAWTFTSERVCVQHRRGLERVYVDGRAFDREGPGPWRVLEVGEERAAGVVLGSAPWAEVLRLDAQGRPLGEPVPLPPAPGDLVGTRLPQPVVAVLTEVLVGQAPRLLQPVVRQVLEGRAIAWGETRPELVAVGPELIEVHAAVVASLPTEPAPLLGVLVGLLQPAVRRAAAAALASAWASAQR